MKKPPHIDPRQIAWMKRCIELADRQHTPEQIETAERALAQPPRPPAQQVLPLA